MNIENLRKLFNESNGELVVKNYPTLCNILGVEPKKGKGKTLQQEGFKRYFRYEKSKQSFIIKEIYSMELDKIDNRGAKGKFTDDLQDIMLNVLSQSTRGELLFSKNVLFKALNMVNNNYRMARYNIPRLSELIEVDEEVIYEFYNDANSKMVDYVENALKRLRSRRLIINEKVLVVAKLVAETNDLGEVKLNFYDDSDIAKVKTKLEYRQATEQEKHIILDIERSVLESLGFSNTQQAFINGMWKEYKKRVTKQVREKLNIKFHFEGYLITYNHKNIMKELAEEDIINYRKSNINNNLLDSFKNNAITRNTNAKEKQNRINEHKELIELYSKEELKAKGIKGTRLTARDKLSLKDNFIDDTVKVANTVISQLAFNLTDQLIKEPTKVTTVEENNNSDLPF